MSERDGFRKGGELNIDQEVSTITHYQEISKLRGERTKNINRPCHPTSNETRRLRARASAVSRRICTTGNK